jgi:hypothetical protein
MMVNVTKKCDDYADLHFAPSINHIDFVITFHELWSNSTDQNSVDSEQFNNIGKFENSFSSCMT